MQLKLVDWLIAKWFIFLWGKYLYWIWLITKLPPQICTRLPSKAIDFQISHIALQDTHSVWRECIAILLMKTTPNYRPHRVINKIFARKNYNNYMKVSFMISIYFIREQLVSAYYQPHSDIYKIDLHSREMILMLWDFIYSDAIWLSLRTLSTHLRRDMLMCVWIRIFTADAHTHK